MKIVLVLVLVVGCSDSSEPAQGSAAVAQPTPIVSNEKLTDLDRDQDQGYIGVLTPRESAELTAPFTTRVLKVAVKLGDTVQKGDLLARLDDRPMKEQLAVEKATLKAHQAQVAQASVEHIGHLMAGGGVAQQASRESVA